MNTQFNAQIQILCSNNGGELVNHDFQAYFQQHGIIHETTCPQTPQQNGVAKRKNQHLLETARALLIGIHMFFHDPASNSTLHREIQSEKQNWSNLENEEIHLCTEAIDHPASDDQWPQGLEHEIALRQETIDRLNSMINSLEFGARDCSLPKSNQSLIHSDGSPDPHDPCDDVSDPSPTHTDNIEQRDENPISNSTVPTDQSSENILEPPNCSPNIGKTSKYPIANHVSTKKLSESLKAFVHQLSAIYIPTKVAKALKDPKWVQAIKEEMKALEKNQTWTLKTLP
ncbi:unnamed protein product [Prunus armeniaca]